jgi:hypothetical protein
VPVTIAVMRFVAMLATLGMAAQAMAMPAPMTIVSDEEADPLRSAIARKEAWTTDAVRHLRADADRRMLQGPWSVTIDRPAGSALDPHDYYSEAAYYWPNPEDPDGPYILREGRLNPERFNANRTALTMMCDTVFALGTAAYLFDDSRYALRAVRVIHTWFINPRTRMNPHLEYAGAIRGLNMGRPEGLLEGRVFIRAIQGMEFLSRTGNWDAKDQEAVRRWFQDYLQWLTQSKYAMEEKNSGNNQASWWTAQVAAVATFVENDAAMKMAFGYYHDRIFPRQIAENGSAPREEARVSPWYSVFNLEAFTLVCRIAQVQGTDLWSVRAKNGLGLGGVIDYLKPYLVDPRRFSREQAMDLDTDALYFLAFAGMGMKNPAYIALYQKLEHPERAWLSLVDLLVGRWEAAGHQTRH